MAGLQMKYFVLKPRGDDLYAKASRRAMRSYASVMQHDNPVLCNQLREWADSETPSLIEDEEETQMSEVKNYRKKTIQPMRPYVPGEDLEGVSVSVEDTPELGGMIAIGADNDARWYVSKGFFEGNYELV